MIWKSTRSSRYRKVHIWNFWYDPFREGYSEETKISPKSPQKKLNKRSRYAKACSIDSLKIQNKSPLINQFHVNFLFRSGFRPTTSIKGQLENSWWVSVWRHLWWVRPFHAPLPPILIKTGLTTIPAGWPRDLYDVPFLTWAISGSRVDIYNPLRWRHDPKSAHRWRLRVMTGSCLSRVQGRRRLWQENVCRRTGEKEVRTSLTEGLCAGKCRRRVGEWKGQCTLLRVRRVLNLNINCRGGGGIRENYQKGIFNFFKSYRMSIKTQETTDTFVDKI